MPLAAHAEWVGEQLHLTVALGHAEEPGRALLKASISAVVQTDAQALALGGQAAQALRDLGAQGYLLPV
jgi:hypothetical protein